MNKKNKQLTIKDELTEFLLYTTPNGDVKVEIFFYDENVWLTQKRMSELFGVGVNTINYHLKEVFKSGELEKKSVIRKYRTTAEDGKKYNTNFSLSTRAVTIHKLVSKHRLLLYDTRKA